MISHDIVVKSQDSCHKKKPIRNPHFIVPWYRFRPEASQWLTRFYQRSGPLFVFPWLPISLVHLMMISSLLGSCTSLLMQTARQSDKGSHVVRLFWFWISCSLWAWCPFTATRRLARMTSFTSRHLSPRGGAVLMNHHVIFLLCCWNYALEWVAWGLEPLF